jgi:hypothetical protein
MGMVYLEPVVPSFWNAVERFYDLQDRIVRQVQSFCQFPGWVYVEVTV